MPQSKFPQTLSLLIVCLLAVSLAAPAYGANYELKRRVSPKKVYTELPDYSNTDRIIFKLSEGMGQPTLNGQGFGLAGAEWNELDAIMMKSNSVRPRFNLGKAQLDQMRAEGSRRIGKPLPDLTLYFDMALDAGMSARDRLDMINGLSALSIVETAYFAPIPELAGDYEVSDALTPAWEGEQYYLQAAPTGVNAYYGWGFPGGHGENVKVIDIEGNWIQTHEDLHGGIDDFHIAGLRVDDEGWWNHGTAVLGEIAADSNDFGMTGISYGVDLGTISYQNDEGVSDLPNALLTAAANSVEGDIILIELHAKGPHQRNYVAMEYWEDNFDAILTVSAMGRIVVEAAGNGDEDYDDVSIYDSLFYPEHRFSGAIMVGASCADHTPASFTNYGIRIDVHGYGCWDVYTLGYGDLYGTTVDDAYTDGFSGTSSASPIIVGACAVLQGVHKAQNGVPLDHDGMRTLLTTYSTPQAEHYKRIGPLPDLQGSCNEIMGGSCCMNRGDADGSGDVDIADIDFQIDYLFKSGAEPTCAEEADADGGGAFDIEDIDYLIGYLFQSGPAPAPCP